MSKLSTHPGIVVGVDGSPASNGRGPVGRPRRPSYATFR